MTEITNAAGRAAAPRRAPSPPAAVTPLARAIWASCGVFASVSACSDKAVRDSVVDVANGGDAPQPRPPVANESDTPAPLEPPTEVETPTLLPDPVVDPSIRALVVRGADLMASGGNRWTYHEDALSRLVLEKVEAPTTRTAQPAIESMFAVMEGQVVFRLPDSEETLEQGDALSIPPHTAYEYRPGSGTALLIEFDAPPPGLVQQPTRDAAIGASETVDAGSEIVVSRFADLVANPAIPARTVVANEAYRFNQVLISTITRHYHSDASHTLIVIKNSIKAFPGNEEVLLDVGDFISIPAMLAHHYQSPGDAAWLVSADAPPYSRANTVQLQQ